MIQGQPIDRAQVAQLIAENEALRKRIAKAEALLRRCRPIVESEMALMDSMARHMAGGFDPKDVQSADDSADFHWVLLREIDAYLKGGTK